MLKPIEFREGQEETINIIKTALQTNHVIILDAPVGSGKSLINLLSVQGHRTYLTTPRTLLVDQYKNDIEEKFQGLGRVVKGKANYPCVHFEPHYENIFPNVNVSNAMCTWEKKDITPNAEKTWTCPDKYKCTYFVDKMRAQKADVAIITLDYFMLGINRIRLESPPDEDMDDYANMDGTRWERREILVVDEAHSLPETLTRFFSIEITKRTFGDFLDYNEMLDLERSLEDKSIPPSEVIRDAFVAKLEEISGEISKYIADHPDETYNLPTYVSMRNKIVRYLRKLSLVDADKWVFEVSKEDKSTKFIWTPLHVGEFMKETWDSFDNIIFSSATFISYSSFLHQLGLDGIIPMIVKMPDTFPSSSAPIYICTNLSISHKTKEQDLPILMREIERLAAASEKYRGLIHCVSYENQQYIMNNASPSLTTRVVSHTSDNRNEQLDLYKKGYENDNSVFLSVNMTEGLDLPDDICRWQIILKTPFRSMGSRWVKKRMELEDGQTWYETDALLQIMQASGRIMRSKDDWGVTYILDSNAARLVKKYGPSLPEWFLGRMSFYKSDVK